jgi:hypothetical protein
MTTFDEREQAFERQFVHEEDRRFQERVRRNRLLARWACERMALGPDAASHFTDTFVAQTVPLDDEALLARLVAELAAAGTDEPVSVLRREMQRCAGLARAESRVGLALDQGSSP